MEKLDDGTLLEEIRARIAGKEKALADLRETTRSLETVNAKLLASEAAWQAGDTCFQTFGGFAFASEYDIERKWRECRLFQTAPISTNMVLSYVAEHVLGLPRSY